MKYSSSVLNTWLPRFHLWLLITVILSACSTPAQPLSPEPTNTREISIISSPAVHEPTSTAIHITINSPDPTSRVTMQVVTPTTEVSTSTGLVAADAAPLIFTGLTSDQRCGRGDVVAFDGHTLYGIPELPLDGSNFLELLPEGAQVDIIDCRLWTDDEDLSWLAVRTEHGKLGWMVIQADKFYVTLYPVPIAPPRALTGIPVGSMVAYVPPSECHEGPVSNAAVATSIGVDFIPVVGDIKGIHEAATGCDMVTGERLGNWRWLGLFGLIGLAEIATIRHAGKITDGLRIADNLDGSLRYSDEAVMLAARNSDTTTDFVKGISKLESGAVGGADIPRLIDKGAPLSDESLQSLAKLEQPCSFSGNTPVTTVTGFKPISQVSVGDQVLAFDEATATLGYYPISATWSHLDHEIIRLVLGTEIVETTPEHPFFVDGQWIPAANLLPGDKVGATRSFDSIVRSIEFIHQPALMYNLTVTQAHTYIVGEGGWLVHNACRNTLRKNLGDPGWGKDIQWQAHHVIPVQLEKQHPFVIDAIEKGGWKIDGAANGIALPATEKFAIKLCTEKKICAKYHSGSHPGYTDQVRARLDDLTRQPGADTWDGARKAKELDKLVDGLRKTEFTGNGKVR